MWKTVIKVFGKVIKYVPKLLPAIAVVAVIGLIIYGIGFGFGSGNGRGDGEGDGTTKVESNVENNDPEVDYYEGAVYPITVNESDYFYNNERVTLEEFLTILTKTGDKVVVEIKDDNASLNAYEALVDALKKEHISYVEK